MKDNNNKNNPYETSWSYKTTGIPDDIMKKAGYDLIHDMLNNNQEQTAKTVVNKIFGGPQDV